MWMINNMENCRYSFRCLNEYEAKLNQTKNFRFVDYLGLKSYNCIPNSKKK